VFFPYSTDAPIYHRPWGTIGLIALNTVVFGLVLSGNVDPEPLYLWYDDGLHPTQWVTSNFLHGGLFHLLGNMAFLWVFGLVVEGKLGWMKFIPCYLSIGVVQCALEQGASILLHLEGGSLGASAILFGLLAMAMVWAPQNEVEVFYWIGWRMGTTSLTIRSVALIYVALESLSALLGWAATANITSALLHLMGAAIGFPLGVVLLRRGAVDCEGWDIFSLRDGKPREVKLHRREVEPLPEASLEEVNDQRATAMQLMKGYLAEGQPGVAAQTYEDCVRSTGPWPLEESVLRSLVKGFQSAKLLPEAKPYLAQYIERFPSRAIPMKLLLAKVLIEHEGRPASGLEVLESIPEGALLSEPQVRARDKLSAEAIRLRDAGVLEVD
jgi:membrane associated rhomboid family serine protease